MTFEIYEYQPSSDGKLEKVVYETLENLDPSEAENPYDYLMRYIIRKRIELEQVNTSAIDKWYEYAHTYNNLRDRVIKELQRRGLDEHDPNNFWGLNHPIVNSMVFHLAEMYLITFGNTEAFLQLDIMQAAPQEIRDLYKDQTRDVYFRWLEFMDNPEVSRPVRPVIPEDDYSKFDKEEAKKIIVSIRDKFVRNNEDTVADALKLCSFLAGAIRRIYNILPADIKNNLSPDDKNILDYGFGLQASLQTRCDSELSEEGLNLINTLLTRENIINDIILLVYSHLKV